MMKYFKILAAIAFIFTTGQSAFSQCDSTAYLATRILGDSYVSDGQVYRALIYDDQEAEFYTTFYGGAKYRIVSMVGLEKEQLIFSLVDEEQNVLFTNEDHNNSPYWDFEFESTIEGKIQAKLDLTKQNSGCAVLLIGFER